jgi:phosphate transport system protein
MSALGAAALRSVRDVMDSFTTRDAQKAENVWQHDRELDDLVARVMRAVVSSMSKDLIGKRRDPEEIECSTHLLFITKNLERVGDHATNIAEVIEFQLSGAWKTQARPKGGDSLQAILAR